MSQDLHNLQHPLIALIRNYFLFFNLCKLQYHE